MIENSKVMIRIEYEHDGIRGASLGEIDKNKLDEIRMKYERDENKLDEVQVGEESFICLMNDEEIAWIDKEAILSFYELEAKSRVYKKDGMEDTSFDNKKRLKIEFYQNPR